MFKFLKNKIIILSLIIVIIGIYMYYNIVSLNINDIDKEEDKKNLENNDLIIVRKDTLDLGQSPQKEPSIDESN